MEPVFVNEGQHCISVFGYSRTQITMAKLTCSFSTFLLLLAGVGEGGRERGERNR